MATKNTKGKTAAEIGAGLLAAGAAAAAGYYFYGSDKAKTHRKIAAKWATDMKKEVMKETAKMKAAGTKDFAKVVDGVAKAYRESRSVSTDDLKRAAAELKNNWDTVQREMKVASRANVKVAKAVGKKAVASATKTVKKVVKKAVKKANAKRSR